MSNPFLPTVSFDPAVISDAALAELRQIALRRVMPLAGEFGTWLHHWCDHEQALRQSGVARGKTMTKHDLASPPVAQWSDGDVGQALVAVTTLSYALEDIAAGGLVDRLVLVISEQAAARLFAKQEQQA